MAHMFCNAMRQASYNEVRMDPELKGKPIESGYALAPTMISEKSSTLFALANIRLTRSQRRGILISPPAHCVWGKTGAFTPGNLAIWIVVVREIMVRVTRSPSRQ